MQLKLGEFNSKMQPVQLEIVWTPPKTLSGPTFLIFNENKLVELRRMFNNARQCLVNTRCNSIE